MKQADALLQMTHLHSYVMLIIPIVDYLASRRLFFDWIDDFLEEVLPGRN